MKHAWFLVMIGCFGCQSVSEVGMQHESVNGPDAGSASSAGLVACGAAECELAQDQACCLGVASGDVECSAMACAAGSSTLSCDGPEDCNGGACCGNLTQGYACTADSSCSAGLQLCHSDADCPGAQPTCCSFSYGDEDLRGCTTAPQGSCS